MPVVFVLHGMGRHEKDWWLGESGVLKKCQKLPRFDAYKEDHPTLESWMESKSGDKPGVEWVELIYDDLLEEIRTSTHSEGDFKQVLEAAKETESNFLTPAVVEKWAKDWSNQADDINLFNSTDFSKNAAWDVFLIFSKLSRHFVAIHVAKQILDFFKQPGNERKEWSLIAHSLGTAVAQDVLNLVEELLRLGDNDNLKSANTVCFLANFSRTIIGDNVLVTRQPFNAANTHVWPSKRGLGSICKHYMSARHKLDPLSYLAKDMPNLDAWKNVPNEFSENKYLILTHDDLNQLPNEISDDLVEFGSFTHSIENYLAHPRIHLPLFSRIHREVEDYQSPALVTAAENSFLETRSPSAQNIANLVLDGVDDVSVWYRRLIELSSGTLFE